jgi:hypothetical protein
VTEIRRIVSMQNSYDVLYTLTRGTNLLLVYADLTSLRTVQPEMLRS